MSIKLETKQTGTEFIFINGELVAINQIKESKLVKKRVVDYWFIKVGVWIFIAMIFLYSEMFLFQHQTFLQAIYFGVLISFATEFIYHKIYKK